MSKPPLKVLFVTSEVTPFSKTGGLADISAALPKALAAQGCDVRVITPRYGFISREKYGIRLDGTGAGFSVDLHGHSVKVALSHAADSQPGLQFLFVECDPLFDRPGLYVDPFTNRDYIDNDYRFIVLCRAAMEACRLGEWTPDIVHCNDWQTGLVPLYLHSARVAGELTPLRSVFTIHNIAYHGMFGGDAARRAGEAQRYFFPGGPVEFYGYLSFLKAGLEFGDALNTVSPTYAREIETTGDYSFGFDSILRARGELSGILNGIDYDVWNPATDPALAERYDASSLEKKEQNKRALCARIGLAYDPAVPLIGMVTRIVAQKGFEIIAPVLREILSLPAQLVLLGSGDPYFEHLFREAAHVFPDRLAVHIGYDEDFSHQIEAGADMFLMPSKFEPCGLNQMMSMRYGTLPIVRATGGLADTVIDAGAGASKGTGFSFSDYTPEALLQTVKRATAARADATLWRALQTNAMAQDFSWKRSAKRYMDLYAKTLKAKPRVIL
ncbi:MAG TPA: glycogen synthase GlgA [bacterium]|jgi:starch synthase